MTAHSYTDTRATAKVRETPPLRWALELDGIGSALNGLAYLVAASALGELFGLSTALLVPAGAFLVAYGAALIVMSTRREVSAVAVKIVIAANVIWMVDSLVVAFSGWFSPAGAGVAWILAQAALVGGFAIAQAAGLRRARA